MTTNPTWWVGTVALVGLAFAAGRATAPRPTNVSPVEDRVSARLSALADLVTRQSRDVSRRFDDLEADCRQQATPHASDVVTNGPAPSPPAATPPPVFESSAATALIDRALPTGRWTPADIKAFRLTMPDLSPQQRDTAVHALIQAINSGALKPTQPGMPM